METTNKIEYSHIYNPETRQLSIYKNGKLLGGFKGDKGEKNFMAALDTNAEINFTTMGTDAKRKQLVRRLRASWIKQGIDKYRHSILDGYGVKSTADLTVPQLEELIDKYSNTRPASEEMRKQRSNVLILLGKLGIYHDQNWAEVNDFLMDKRVVGKILYQLTVEELKVLSRKLHSMLDKKTSFKSNLNRPEINN